MVTNLKMSKWHLGGTKHMHQKMEAIKHKKKEDCDLYIILNFNYFKPLV